ncbi:unnamed protein product [Rotaria socialis]|uniref:Proteasome activator PA28 C-terminal domain-containing protein n=1 Tax=Rotaria socialis TaxID=392032 RepID=A0A818WUX0_9BILA|nr:unnamed protein product [Rotaria socialis]CAF4602873.1 unnamed protein product [Rotaria socialis]
MRPKKLNNSIDETDRELIQALELDGKNIENLIKENVEKLDRMLDDDDLFNQTNLKAIQSLARESVVNVPTLIGNKLNDDKSSLESHLVIKSNERLEILVERVRHEVFFFIENAEKIRVLIDLNVMHNNGIDYETQCLWKSQLIQMQGQISSNHMDILNYYQNRSDIGISILNQPRASDCWEQLIEIDEDFFFKLRIILHNLRLFNVRLYDIVYRWIYFPNKLM